MKTFKHFPEDKICPMCGSGEDRECVSIPIDDTGDGNICETILVHADCATKGDLRFNRQVNIFYKVAVTEIA